MVALWEKKKLLSVFTDIYLLSNSAGCLNSNHISFYLNIQVDLQFKKSDIMLVKCGYDCWSDKTERVKLFKCLKPILIILRVSLRKY